MLINLSNHPSHTWSLAQLQAARMYGDIVDLQFPDIHPEISLQEVQGIVAEYEKTCLHHYEQASQSKTAFAIHVMGELTFTFHFLLRMRDAGIPCVASTTRRVVQNADDGGKISRFEFVRFRSYF